MSKNSRRRVRGLVPTFILLFSVSAILRLMDVGVAVASDAEPILAVPSTQSSDELAIIARDLLEENERLEAWTRKLELRAKDLEMAEVEIREALSMLQSAEEALAARMSASASASDDDLGQLTAVYEAMKPKDAAEIFETMPPEFAAGFLARMQATSAAAVFASLSPEQAYSVSVVLAGRNVNAAKE